MKVKCIFGFHDWGGCKCTRCAKTRDIEHAWSKNCESWTCIICGKKQPGSHSWNGCKCAACGITREESHAWEGCKCAICGKVRDMNHDWSNRHEKCVKCGAPRPNCYEKIAAALDAQYRDELRKCEREMAEIRAGTSRGSYQFTSLAQMHYSLEAERASGYRTLAEMRPSQVQWTPGTFEYPSNWQTADGELFPPDAKVYDIYGHTFHIPSLRMATKKKWDLTNKKDAQWKTDHRGIVESMLKADPALLPGVNSDSPNPFLVLSCKDVVLPMYNNRALQVFFEYESSVEACPDLSGVFVFVERSADIYVLRALCASRDWKELEALLSYATMTLHVT